MTKVSDNLFPKIIVVEGAAPATPASGNQMLFIDVADHKVKRKDSSGTVTQVESTSTTAATTTTTGTVKVDNNMAGAPIAVTTASVGAASGVASLDGSSHVTLAQLSGIAHTQIDAAAGITFGQIASVSPAALTGTGTVPLAALTDMVASGASHARGIVPDPGASAGSSRFLCEDGTFAVPSGAGAGTLELTDGTHDLTAVTKVTVSKMTVGGTSAAATLTPSGITHAELDAAAGITSGQIASVNPSALTGSGTVPLAALSSLTTAQLAVAAGILAAQIVTGGIIAEGTHAGRPAAGQAGLLYRETDTLKVFRDSGSAWVEWDFTAAVITSGLLAAARGGLGLDASGATSGQLPIGNGSGFTLATLTAGTGISISNAAGGITINASGVGGGGTALSTASAQLSADVTITTANTFYDALSLSLAAGTWIIWASTTIAAGAFGTGTTDVTAVIWDGTTAYASGTTRVPSQNVQAAIALVTPPIVLGSTTTLKLSGTSTDNAGKIKAALASNPKGNTATSVVALKVG